MSLTESLPPESLPSIPVALVCERASISLNMPTKLFFNLLCLLLPFAFAVSGDTETILWETLTAEGGRAYSSQALTSGAEITATNAESYIQVARPFTIQSSNSPGTHVQVKVSYRVYASAALSNTGEFRYAQIEINELSDLLPDIGDDYFFQAIPEGMTLHQGEQTVCLVVGIQYYLHLQGGLSLGMEGVGVSAMATLGTPEPLDVDLVAGPISWNAEGGVNLTISATNSQGYYGPEESFCDPMASLYWAKGKGISDILPVPVIIEDFFSIGPAGPENPLHLTLPKSYFENPPINATHLLLVMDRDNLFTEKTKANNVAAVPLPGCLKWVAEENGDFLATRIGTQQERQSRRTRFASKAPEKALLPLDSRY